MVEIPAPSFMQVLMRLHGFELHVQEGIRLTRRNDLNAGFRAGQRCAPTGKMNSRGRQKPTQAAWLRGRSRRQNSSNRKVQKLWQRGWIVRTFIPGDSVAAFDLYLDVILVRPVCSSGREIEMDQLRASLEATLSGNGRLMILVGEPGSGKTRAADEFASQCSSWWCKFRGLTESAVAWFL